jgi:hypothetical protein
MGLWAKRILVYSPLHLCTSAPSYLYLPPHSHTQALLIEETYNEEVLGRAVSLEALSTGTVINCTKVETHLFP